MSEQKGVGELKEVLVFVVALIQAVVESVEDGKVGLTDLLKFFKAFRKAGPAFKGISNVRAEIKDLSDAEKDELSKYVADELKISNAVIEAYIEQALALVISLLDLLPLAHEAKK